MSWRVCSTPGCGTLVEAGRCQACERRRNQTRPRTAARGYGSAHQQLRADYQRRMDAGERFSCWRCGRPIDPRRWHLGHCDRDRRLYHGPECVPSNTATAGRTGDCPHPSHASAATARA